MVRRVVAFWIFQGRCLEDNIQTGIFMKEGSSTERNSNIERMRLYYLQLRSFYLRFVFFRYARGNRK